MEKTGGRPAKGSSAMVSRDCLGHRRSMEGQGRVGKCMYDQIVNVITEMAYPRCGRKNICQSIFPCVNLKRQYFNIHSERNPNAIRVKFHAVQGSSSETIILVM